MSAALSVALVTAVAARHLDEDLPPLALALGDAGHRTEICVWDDPAVAWDTFDVVVVRSTWDYVPRREDLLAWAAAVEGETLLANPASVLRWSTDKRYLADLAAAGVAVVPTTFWSPGDDVQVPAGVEVVVKPAVSAGSADTDRYHHERGDAASHHVRRLLDEGRVAMVQPYLHAVDDHGETAMVFFGGRYSHAIRKGAILRPDGVPFVEGLYAAEEISSRTPTAAEDAVAAAALDAVPGGRDRLLYARVDLVPGPDGSQMVLELELAEPSVFLDHSAGAAERFASAIEAWVEREGRSPRP